MRDFGVKGGIFGGEMCYFPAKSAIFGLEVHDFGVTNWHFGVEMCDFRAKSGIFGMKMRDISATYCLSGHE